MAEMDTSKKLIDLIEIHESIDEKGDIFLMGGFVIRKDMVISREQCARYKTNIDEVKENYKQEIYISIKNKLADILLGEV